MGFYIRKSVSVGPFRFNLSKSGVGVSAGVPGFRVGMSPRGNYVSLGRGGLYYRTTLTNRSRPSSVGSSRPLPTRRPQAPQVPQGSQVEMRAIESAEATSIVDSSSAELVAEMNSKHKKLQLWPWILGGGICLTIFASAQPWPIWISDVLAAVTIIGGVAAAIGDRLRKTTVLMYHLDGDAEQRFQKLHEAFTRLAESNGRWHITARGRVDDRKYHAGASSLINRSAFNVCYQNPPFVKSNIDVPSMPSGKQVLYFFPDRVLVFSADGVGAVSYQHLEIGVRPGRFVEDGSLPRDAQVVGKTWRFVNKNGGPDRRFKNNRELPIALYEEIAFSSGTGLNELVQISRHGAGKAISDAARALAVLTS